MSYVLSPARGGAPSCADAGPFATWGEAADHRATLTARTPSVTTQEIDVINDEPAAAVNAGPMLGRDLVEQVRPPARPARVSKRAHVERWDSTPHRIEVTDVTGRRVAGYTVAGRASAAAVIATHAELLVTIRSGRA